MKRISAAAALRLLPSKFKEIKVRASIQLKKMIDTLIEVCFRTGNSEKLIEACFALPESSQNYEDYRLQTFQYLFYQAEIAEEDKVIAFVNALKSLIKNDGTLLFKFKNAENQLIFDAALASAVRVTLVSDSEGFKSLDPAVRLRYLNAVLSKWTPTEADDIAFKLKWQSDYINGLSSRALQAFGLLSGSKRIASEDSSLTQDFKK